MRTLTSEQREYAKKLLDEAILYQIDLEKGQFRSELIDRTTPVLWFGDISERSWLTIATKSVGRPVFGPGWHVTL